MKNLNLKIRLKNKTFIVTMMTTVIAFVYQMLAQFEIVPKVTQDQTLQVVMLVVNILAGLGILVDPTTDGVKDSERVLNKK
ncbi:phage holin [uncultured Parvimonas sp.]|jgi:holin, phage phi LC3 family|uniref:phage holin n=1 Tax=uncultured Parvimonas sp. TaxID=747372 RepID=UPI0020689A58|nr:MAG TPA: holin [Caudoviricetes sp.]DAS24860.1 MAG TPA: holin [Caudoviricetes sp.]